MSKPSPKKFQLTYVEKGSKVCSLCNVEKDNSEFYLRKNTKSNQLRLRSRCKECMHLEKHEKSELEPKRQEYRKNKERISRRYNRLQNLLEKSKCPTYVKISMKERNLIKNYNMSMEEYLERVDSQQGKCYICKELNSYGKNRELRVDHDHSTGKVRKLLCDRCNLTLGKCKDSPELLMKMVDYLKEHKDE